VPSPPLPVLQGSVAAAVSPRYMVDLRARDIAVRDNVLRSLAARGQGLPVTPRQKKPLPGLRVVHRVPQTNLAQIWQIFTTSYKDIVPAYNALAHEFGHYPPVEAFAKAARKWSQCCDTRHKGGALGWMARSQLSSAMASVAWRVELDSISVPFRTEMGFHVILVTARK